MFSALSVVFLLGWAYAYFVLVFALKWNETRTNGKEKRLCRFIECYVEFTFSDDPCTL